MKNKMDLIKNFDKLRMAHFLSDIRKNCISDYKLLSL